MLETESECCPRWLIFSVSKSNLHTRECLLRLMVYNNWNHLLSDRCIKTSAVGMCGIRKTARQHSCSVVEFRFLLIRRKVVKPNGLEKNIVSRYNFFVE